MYSSTLAFQDKIGMYDVWKGRAVDYVTEFSKHFLVLAFVKLQRRSTFTALRVRIR